MSKDSKVHKKGRPDVADALCGDVLRYERTAAAYNRLSYFRIRVA